MSSLFDISPTDQPLAERMRPQKLQDYLGQKHILGQNKILRQMINKQSLSSLIFWGPPGSGKTSLARLLSKEIEASFFQLSAVQSGLKDLRSILEKAQEEIKLYKRKSILFIDEIHRFNKAQQDGLLPAIEDGSIILIGATTENPSFEIISPLLSRCQVLQIKKLDDDDLKNLITKTLIKEKGTQFSIEPKAMTRLVHFSDGDARKCLNRLEIALQFIKTNQDHLKIEDINKALTDHRLSHDKNGEDHYNLISAYIKSIRGSDPDAAVYYLARLLEAGEDPLFIARRMVIAASEDIGNADPNAIQVAIACQQAFHFIGMPEGWIPLSQASTYLASAPKSNASYMAYKKAQKDVIEYASLEVPLHLRNAPTQLMKDIGYAKSYEYAHDQKEQKVSHAHLPEKLVGRRYYQPKEIGFEKKIKELLNQKKK